MKIFPTNDKNVSKFFLNYCNKVFKINNMWSLITNESEEIAKIFFKNSFYEVGLDSIPTFKEIDESTFSYEFFFFFKFFNFYFFFRNLKLVFKKNQNKIKN